jgi:MtN3 and saliva related transmembrane protein
MVVNMGHGYISGIGFAAATINICILIPQVVKTLRTKQTRDLSRLTFTLMASSAFLWIVYGVATMNWPIVLANSFTLCFDFIILVMKARHG